MYELLNKEGFIAFSLTQESKNKTEALVANITSIYFGDEIYKTNEEKVVAYLYFLIKNHPFIDGNKRTAVLTFEVVCEINDLEPDYKDITLDELAVYIEQTKTDDHQGFIKLISRFLFKQI